MTRAAGTRILPVMDSAATLPVDADADPAHASTILTIDTDAVVRNWRLLAARTPTAAAAAVVKADAYGLGIARVAPALHRAGCRTFFVATVPEAVTLRGLLPDPATATILALNGSPPGAEALCRARAIVPVVNTLAQLARWRAEASTAEAALPLALQLDTGMSRFGLPPEDAAALAAGEIAIASLRPTLLMSHLASADSPDDPANATQLARFRAARDALRPVLGPVPASLSACSGVFLGADFHFDLIRPGAALYGVHPGPAAGPANPMHPTIRLDARVAQLRRIPPGTAVGYGTTWTAPAPTRVATVACGYADGFLRSGGNRGAAALPDATLLPIIGRISMDSITLDATTPAADGLREGDLVTLIGPGRPLDDVASDAGTIGYEILTALGRRHLRREGPVV